MPLHSLHPLDILLRKRDGFELTAAELQTMVHAIVRSGELQSSGVEAVALTTNERITDAQIASFLMAVFQRGLSRRELADLTIAMRFSGETFNLSSLDAFTVDKHSTGGVGDKTSLLIAPIVAAAGKRGAGRRGKPRIAVPMISGRSLGHTGGTLDKLESIPGFDTQLSLTATEAVLRRCGAAMIGQTPRLVPADRILYALRDHTGTVESPALITASIMSKKLAEDLRGLVLDVKVGSGAFMPTEAASRHLAELLVATGEAAGTRTVALLTRMDEPLGRFAGNWVEVWECVDILQGRPHPLSADLLALTHALAGTMLALAGAAADAEAGAALSAEIVASGEAWAAWLCIVEAQGGDPAVFNNCARVHQPKAMRILRAARSGYLAAMDCKEVGWAVQRLGAGRSRPGEPVSAHASLEVHAKLGDSVQAGQPLFTLFSEDPALLEEPFTMLAATVQIADEPPRRPPLIQEVVSDRHSSAREAEV